jgi:hypothetical protein
MTKVQLETQIEEFHDVLVNFFNREKISNKLTPKDEEMIDEGLCGLFRLYVRLKKLEA